MPICKFAVGKMLAGCDILIQSTKFVEKRVKRLRVYTFKQVNTSTLFACLKKTCSTFLTLKFDEMAQHMRRNMQLKFFVFFIPVEVIIVFL